MSDKRTRWVIEATHNLDTVAPSLEKIIALLQKQNQLTALQTSEVLRSMNDQKGAIDSVTKAVENLNNRQQTQVTNTNQHKSAITSLRGEYDLLSRNVTGIMGLMAGAWATSQLKSYLMEVVNAKSAQDGFTASLESMIGSKIKAEQINAQLMAIAAKSPFSIEDIQQVTLRLKGMGVETNQLIPMIEMLGNISAVVGKDKLPLIAKALTDVQSKGTLMKQELNQFAENGINLYDLLAKSMQKPREEIIKLANDHKISYDQVLKALQTATQQGGIYYNQMKIQAEQLGGKVANLSDIYTLAKAKIGDFYENGIKAGIKATGDLIESTIGSESAIKRTVETIKTAAAIYITYRTAVLTTSAALKANQVETLKDIAAKDAATLATVGYTASTGSLSTAMSGLWAVARANPLGALLTVLGAVYGAYQLWEVATMEVKSALGEEEIQLKNQQSHLTQLVESAMQAEKGTTKRTEAIQQLIREYPDYFKGLDAETATNEQLRGILDSVNRTYVQRIALAREAYRTAELEKQRGELLKREFDLMERIREKSPELYAQVNGDVTKLVAAMKNMTSEQLQNLNASGNLLKNIWNDVTQGTVRSAAISIETGLKKVDQALLDSSKSTNTLLRYSQQASVDAENQRWQEVSKSMKKGSDEYKTALAEHNTKLDDLLKVPVGTHAKAQGEMTDAEKRALEARLKANEAMAQKTEQMYMEHMKLLSDNKLRQIEWDIEQQRQKELAGVEKSKATETLKAEARKAINQKFDAEIEKARKESAERLNAELNKIYNKNVSDRQKQADAIVAEVEKQVAEELEAHRKRQEQMAKLDQEYLQLRKNLAKAVEDLEAQRLANLTQMLGQERLIMGNHFLERAKQEHEAAKGRELLAGAEYNMNLGRYGADNPLTKAARNNLTEAQTATTAAAQSVAAGTASLVLAIVDAMVQMGQQALAVINDIRQKYVESTRLAADSLDKIATKIDGLVDQNRNAANEMLKDTSLSWQRREQIMEESIANERALLDQKSSMLLMKQQLEDVAAQTEYTMKESQLAMGTLSSFLKGDFLGGIQGVFKQIEHAYNKSADEWERQERRRLQEIYFNHEKELQLLQRRREQEDQYHAANMKRIDEEENRIKDTINKQIALHQARHDKAVQLINDELAAWKKAQAEITAQFEQEMNDKKLRAQEDHNFRIRLMEDGRARSIKDLEEARDRELKRAQESGATEHELADIKQSFAQQIADTHKKYEEAKGDKSKETALAIQELDAKTKDHHAEMKDAQEKRENEVADRIQKLTDTLEAYITKQQKAIAKATKDAAEDRTAENRRHAENVSKINEAMFNAQKSLTGLEIDMEIVKLKAAKHRLFSNKSALNAAIGELMAMKANLDASYYHGPDFNEGNPPNIPDHSRGGQSNQDGGSGRGGDSANNTSGDSGSGRSNSDGGGRPRFNGDPWLERLNGEPYGVDTIPIRAHLHERIVQTRLNELLGPDVSNEELVHGYLKYQKLLDNMPKLDLHINPTTGQIMMPEVRTLNIPAIAERRGTAQDVGYAELRRDVQRLEKTFRDKSLVAINIDGGALTVTEIGQQERAKHIDNLLYR